MPVSYTTVVLILFGSAIIAWGPTEAAKKALANRFKYVDGADAAEVRKRLWWTPLLVVLCMLIGFGAGCAMGAVSWAALPGGITGACGGALTSFLVSLFKGNITRLIKGLGGGDDPK